MYSFCLKISQTQNIDKNLKTFLQAIKIINQSLQEKKTTRINLEKKG